MSIRQITIGVTLFVWAVVALGQSPPSNDDFADRTVLTGSSITFSGTLAGATLESAETNGALPMYGGHPAGSVWWTWTAPQSSMVVIQILLDQSPPGAATGLTVFSGTNLDALTALVANSFDTPAGRYVQFAATAGTAYQFQVEGNWNRPFTLKLTATNLPVFLVQPQDWVVSPYGSAFFWAMANLPHGSGGHVIGYQWTFNGVPILNATNPCLLVHSVTTNNAGSYSVIASNAAGTTQSAEVTLTITDTNPVPRLGAVPPGNSTQVPFTMTGEVGRIYKIESSRDLQNWVNPTRISLTNANSSILVSRLGDNHFVRASLDLPTDICIAQLRQFWAAVHMYAIENALPASSGYTLDDLRPYLPIGPTGDIPTCPGAGTYVYGVTVTNPVICYRVYHVMPYPF